MNKSIALLLSFCGTFSMIASAADYPLKAYDATYARASAMGTSSYRMCSDGKGHMRVDAGTPGSDRKTIMIMDYPKKESIMLLEQQKVAMIMPLSTESSTSGPMDDEKMKALGGKSLPPKVIDGHPCHGYTWAKNGVTTETWTGDDTGCLVHSVTIQPNSREVMHLEKYVGSSPTPDTFAVPAGYTRQKMPTAPGGR